MAALFSKLRGMFLSRWDDQFATEQMLAVSMHEWGIGLYGMTAKQIKRALDRTRQECQWPPSIAQFRQFGGVRTWEQAGAAYGPYKKLPRPQRNQAVAETELSKMKGVLSAHDSAS